MKTVLIFGASVTHGVGGEHGGWADKLKVWLHSQMFGANGKGEICTVYELGVTGDTSRDVIGRFEVETLARIHKEQSPKDIIVVFLAGTNDSKAVDIAENFVSTPDEFGTNVQAFIRLAKTHAAHVLCVGLFPVAQTKTNPTAVGTFYFTNQRLKHFEAAMIQACQRERAACLPMFDAVPDDWQMRCLADDGLHPNDIGHQWIFEQVKTKLGRII